MPLANVLEFEKYLQDTIDINKDDDIVDLTCSRF
jgi:hypothetical protein